MRKFVLAAAFATLGGGVVAGEIVIPQDTVPFTVKLGDVVRIPTKGLLGIVPHPETKFSTKVLGPAKGVVNVITTREAGKRPVGPGTYELDVTPTGKGEVTVDILVNKPTGEVVKAHYSFKVE
jgi:hypothetical protein